MKLEKLNWEKVNGLIPVIIQDHVTAQILMLGYMNREALENTLKTQKVTFYSRSKQRLWQKGETSGHFFKLYKILPDCDQDALLILVEPIGPACHTGSISCFGDENKVNIIQQLRFLIQRRKQERPLNSYVSTLLSKGTPRIAQKIGEEGVEVALAAALNDKQTLIEEMADLLFHALILIEDQEITPDEILNTLKERQA